MILTEDQVNASLCKESFKHFVQEHWDEVPGTQPLVWSWHMDIFCDELQYIAELVFQRAKKEHDLLVNVSPGTSKSTIFSILFQPWTWTRMPSARHIYASHTEDLVLDLAVKSRTVVLSEKYRRLFPDIIISEDQNTKGYYRNTLGGDRLSCTVGGKSPMGFHAHFIGVDDPIDPKKALSELEMKSANEYMTHTLPSRKVDKDVSVFFTIMQRLHENDPSNVMLGWENVRHICLPAKESEHIKPARLKDKYVDGLMDPVRLSERALAEAEKRLGQYAFAGQFMQNPIPLGGGMFKTARLKYGEPVPGRGMFRGLCRYWDKAGTAGGGAFTAGVLLGEDKQGRFWILSIVRGQWDSAEREQVIKRTAIQDTKEVIVVFEQEPGSGGKESAEASVRNLAGWRVRVHKVGASDGSKVTRADPFSVQVNAGNVYLAEGSWHEDLVDEMRHFPFSRYKDQIDACSGAFLMLTRKQIVIGGMPTHTGIH
jgi:predicted phage terminase large subunit-like protein